MTRTHKTGDRDHVGLANGTAAPEEHLPRYFGKAGFADSNPNNTKKQGGGKGNWGQAGMSELEDYAWNPTKPRRRTNSFSTAAGHSALKTKFEAIDAEEAVQYEAALHGPGDSVSSSAVAEYDDDADGDAAHQYALEKLSTSSSSADTLASVEEEGGDGAAAGVAANAAGAAQQ